MPPEIPVNTNKFEELVRAKMQAGLDRKQAEHVVKAQLAHDKTLSEAAAEPADDTKKKPAKD